jgi:hypothetical protein
MSMWTSIIISLDVKTHEANKLLHFIFTNITRRLFLPADSLTGQTGTGDRYSTPKK